MTSVSSLFAQNSPYESSIQQILQLEALKKVQMQSQQKELNTQKKALSDIDSRLSALNTLLTSFQESPADKLKPLTGTSSNPDAVSIISTAGLNNPGSYSIDVSQIAKEDIVLSDAISDTASDYNSTGTGSFDLAIGSDGPVTIEVNTTGLNNSEVLEAIATEVNNQLGEKVTASVFQVGDGTSRLSFKSVETGKASRISVSNQQGDFTGLNLSNVYTESELNAKFTIDNVAFERSSNLIDDTIDGLTFELKKETTTTEKLNITRDTEEARSNIEDFIAKFNEVNKTIRSQTFLNAETGDRGPLQNERTVRNLSLKLRQKASLPVDSLSGTAISSLSAIGIEMEQDGTMKIADSDKLDQALTSDPDAVANLYSVDDGVAANLQQEIDLYVKGSNNIFDSIKDGIDRKLERLDTRIQAENRYLQQKEEQLRKEFADLEQIISQGEYQYNQVLNFQSRLNSFG